MLFYVIYFNFLLLTKLVVQYQRLWESNLYIIMKKTIKNNSVRDSQTLLKNSFNNNSILQAELQEVNHSLNLFLRKQFKIAICPNSFDLYLTNVQDLFIHLTTSKISTLISSLFSKIGNILQPFINHNYMVLNDQIRNQVALYQEKCKKYQTKIKFLKQQLQQYHKKSNKIMNFIYSLRLNNINIDKLYQLSIAQINTNKSINKSQNQFKKQKKQLKIFTNNGKFTQQQKLPNILQKDDLYLQQQQSSNAFKKKIPIYQNQTRQFPQQFLRKQVQKIKISTNQTNRSKQKKTQKSIFHQKQNK